MAIYKNILHTQDDTLNADGEKMLALSNEHFSKLFDAAHEMRINSNELLAFIQKEVIYKFLAYERDMRNEERDDELFMQGFNEARAASEGF